MLQFTLHFFCKMLPQIETVIRQIFKKVQCKITYFKANILLQTADAKYFSLRPQRQ